MPTERLIIDNFKGISHLDLEVKPFTVLIGPQSVPGKSVPRSCSTISKRFHCKYFMLR